MVQCSFDFRIVFLHIHKFIFIHRHPRPFFVVNFAGNGDDPRTLGMRAAQ